MPLSQWSKRLFRRTPDSNTQIVPLVRERIRIPQPPERPIDIHTKDLIRKEYTKVEPWWFILHRKGIRRPQVGEDPLERRAVPKTVVRGTLPERILYNTLVEQMHMTDGIDFDFQSSQDGGRVELGGIVADFLFPIFRFIIQVQGPTHTDFLRHAKDEEQKSTLREMGYDVFEITDTDIYNEAKYENWIRNTFNLGGVGVGSGGIFNATMQTGVSGNAQAFSQINNGNEGELANEATYNSALGILAGINASLN